MKHLVGLLVGPVIETTVDLQEKMDAVALHCRFTVVARAFHQFKPIGATGVLVLAESHFSAHTYPEDGKVYLDVFCCSPDFDPSVCAAVIEEVFGGKLSWSLIDRST